MQLEDLVTNIGDWIFDAALVVQARGSDARGPVVLWCNRGYCDLTGEQPGQIIGQPLRLAPPVASDASQEDDPRLALAEGRPIQQILHDVGPDGRPRWLELRLRSIPDAAGAPLYWLACLRDITARRTQESQAAIELKRLQACAAPNGPQTATNVSLARAAHVAWDGMAVTDADGAITWTNAAFTRITGYSQEEVRGRQPGQLLRGPGTDPAALSAIATALRERQHLHAELEYSKECGTPFWAEVELNPQYSEDGAFIGFVAILKDITERHESATKLQSALFQASSSLDLLNNIAAEAPAVLFQFTIPRGKALRMSFISPEAQRAFGLAASTFIKQPAEFLAMIPPHDLSQLRDTFIAAEAIQCPIERELCLNCHGEGCKWFTLRARPRRLANGQTQWTGSMVNSTREHRQRDELKTLLDLNASVLDASPFGIMGFDAVRNSEGFIEDFKLVLANRVTAKKLGRETDCLLERSMSEVFPGVTQTPAFAQYLRAMETGEIIRFEIFYRGHGLQSWLQIYAGRRGENGLTLLINDITDLKQAQDKIERALAAARQSAEDEHRASVALIASERRLRAALEISDVWVWDVDFTTGIIQGDFAKDFSTSETGNAASSLSLVHVDDHASVAAAWQAFSIGETPEFNGEFRIRFPDDAFRWVRSKGATTEWDDAGKPTRAIGAMVNIHADRALTERLRAVLRDSDLALMESEALSRRLDLATNASGIGVWEVDISTGRLTWTRPMYEIYGREADGADLTHHDWVDALHPDEREQHQAYFLAQIEHPGRFSLDFRILRYGEVRHIRSLAQVFQDRFGRSTVIGVNWDVTEQVLAQRSLEERRREAEAASVAKSQFLANMSHEIRTPMNGVLGMAGALAGTELTTGQAEMVKVIQTAGESLMTVLNDILDFSKIEAGHMEMEKTAFSLADLAGRIRSLHALKAQARAIDLEVNCTEPPSQQRLGDPHRLMQILHNLVSNALKFTAQGFVRVNLMALEEHRVMLEVIDSGIGLSQEQQATIFQHFTQADASTTRQFGGTGLGLSIVRGLAEAMGGTVAVDSKLGEGATFRVVIPAASIANAPVWQSEAAPSQIEPQPRTLNILAAEDNATNRFVLRTLLAPTGAAITFAVNGLEAVELWRTLPFDLVLMDISMPVMDGQEALKTIRSELHQANSPAIPILAVTANAFDHQAAHYRALGFNDVVPKPIQPERLMSAIQAALAAMENGDTPLQTEAHVGGGEGEQEAWSIRSA